MNFLKYPGGKHSELPIIKEYMPETFDRYYEPFVGGGAVFFDTKAKKYLINDKSNDLICLYESVQKEDKDLFKMLTNIEKSWNKSYEFSIKNLLILKKIYCLYKEYLLTENEMEYMVIGFIEKNNNKILEIINCDDFIDKNIFITEIKKYLIRKLKNIKKLNEKSELSEEDLQSCFEGVFKGSFYMYIRNLYNKSLHNKKLFKKGQIAVLYLFIRETAYSSMFRFNDNGDFNVPYGGITYNNKTFTTKIELYKNEEIIKKLKLTTIQSLDFYDFMTKYPPKKEDFIFIDPPYDSEFSSYDQSKFEQSDQKRLANYLINNCEAMFMAVIKNTEFISSLYPIGKETKNGGKINIIGFDKKYSVSFMNRNNKECEHLIITNYDLKKGPK